MLVGASVLGSATTLMGESALRSAGYDVDTYIPNKEAVNMDDSFVRTASSRSTAMAAAVDFTGVAESTINSVVSIKSFETPKQQQYYQGIDPFEFFFGPGFGFGNGQRGRQQQQQQQSEPQAKGSGTLNDNSKYNATVVGTDPNTDIALIKINGAKNLHPITFGNSDNVKVGEWAVAVGNPFGFNSTVTAGIISAKGRGIAESSTMGIKSFIQHDAAVNPGNSGGALVNMNGELIGINTMIYSTTGTYSGCSFSVPSNTVKKVVTDLKQYGTVQRAVFGIQYKELDADMAKEHKITATNEGIYVAKVNDRSAAMEAGLEEGDVIVKLNGVSVKNSGEMQEQMNKLRPGDKAEVSYYRDNKLRTTTVTFKNNQGNTKITKNSDVMSLGCAFAELSSKEKKDMNISHGVKVAGLQAGKFKANGIKNGLIITHINQQPVDSQEDVEQIYNQIMRSQDDDKVMVITGLTQTGKKVYYAVDLSDVEE